MRRAAALLLAAGLGAAASYGACLAWGQSASFTPVDRAAIVAASPVQSVNGATGEVVVPTLQRQVSPALDISKGALTWTFPTPFVAQPTCTASVSSNAADYVFSTPVTATSQVSVSVSMSAAVAIPTLILGKLTLWGAPPAGTTITLTCVGASP